MVGGGDEMATEFGRDLPQCAIPRLPRRLFPRGGRGGNFHTHDTAGDTPLRGRGLHHVSLVIRFGAQAVVNINGRQLFAGVQGQVGEEVQQDERINPARNAHHKGGGGGNTAVAPCGENVGRPIHSRKLSAISRKQIQNPKSPIQNKKTPSQGSF